MDRQLIRLKGPESKTDPATLAKWAGMVLPVAEGTQTVVGKAVDAFTGELVEPDSGYPVLATEVMYEIQRTPRFAELQGECEDRFSDAAWVVFALDNCEVYN